MTIELTIAVPDELGQELQRVQERLPEILERGLREVLAEEPSPSQDEQAIISILATQPSPEQVLALRPSAELQARVSELLARSKTGTLTTAETVELERHLLLEHLVRMAKAHAYQRQARP